MPSGLRSPPFPISDVRSFQDKCTPMDCGAPARAHVDFSSCADAQHFAETCTPACERGYTGTPTAVCNGVAEWVYGGECRPVDCGPVARASVKAVDCADTAFGGQCAVACADGYTGSATAVCGADGAWVYTEDCVPVDCGVPLPKPPAPAPAVVPPAAASPGDSARTAPPPVCPSPSLPPMPHGTSAPCHWTSVLGSGPGLMMFPWARPHQKRRVSFLWVAIIIVHVVQVQQSDQRGGGRAGSLHATPPPSQTPPPTTAGTPPPPDSRLDPPNYPPPPPPSFER